MRRTHAETKEAGEGDNQNDKERNQNSGETKALEMVRHNLQTNFRSYNRLPVSFSRPAVS